MTKSTFDSTAAQPVTSEYGQWRLVVERVRWMRALRGEPVDLDEECPACEGRGSDGGATCRECDGREGDVVCERCLTAWPAQGSKCSACDCTQWLVRECAACESEGSVQVPCDFCRGSGRVSAEDAPLHPADQYAVERRGGIAR
jgi:hypothetical protein